MVWALLGNSHLHKLFYSKIFKSRKYMAPAEIWWLYKGLFNSDISWCISNFDSLKNQGCWRVTFPEGPQKWTLPIYWLWQTMDHFRTSWQNFEQAGLLWSKMPFSMIYNLEELPMAFSNSSFSRRQNLWIYQQDDVRQCLINEIPY